MCGDGWLVVADLFAWGERSREFDLVLVLGTGRTELRDFDGISRDGHRYGALTEGAAPTGFDAAGRG
jgi:hypothetical protein